jgi:hypothetical protein
MKLLEGRLLIATAPKDGTPRCDDRSVIGEPGHKENPYIGFGVIFSLFVVGGLIFWRANRWVNRQ